MGRALAQVGVWVEWHFVHSTVLHSGGYFGDNPNQISRISLVYQDVLVKALAL